MDKSTIAEAFSLYGTDKGPRRHNYQQAYSAIFEEHVPESLLEVGVLQGQSLAAWKHLLPNSTVHGIELRNHEIVEAAADIPIFRGNAADPSFINSVVTQPYDLVIDDGDHRPDVQWQVFLNMMDKWTKHYVIEDVCIEENEKLLRKRLHSKGFRNIRTWTSSFNAPNSNLRGWVQVKGEKVYPPFYIMVITRE